RDVAQRVEDEFVEPFEQRHRRIRKGAEIGEIGGASEAKTQHFDIAVQQGDGNKWDAKQFEGALADDIQDDAGHGAQRGLVVEDIGKDAPDDSKGVLIAVNRNGRALVNVVRPNIIEPENVVGVAVGEQNGVEAVQPGAHGLLAKVGSGVDDHVVAVAGN